MKYKMPANFNSTNRDDKIAKKKKKRDDKIA
jgi:hypothetical protein